MAELQLNKVDDFTVDMHVTHSFRTHYPQSLSLSRVQSLPADLTEGRLTEDALRLDAGRSARISEVSFLGDAKSSLGDAKSSLGDAKSSLGDAKSSLGDAKSSLGDAKSSLGDAESSLGELC